MVAAVADSSSAMANVNTRNAQTTDRAASRAMRRSSEVSKSQTRELAQQAEAVKKLNASKSFANEAARYTELRAQAQTMRLDSASFDRALSQAVSN